MALKIDTTRAFRRHTEQVALIQAVVNGLPEDESDWVEWKTPPVLETPFGRGNLARHILGMSNRMPLRASRFAEGFGYVLVGVEPANLIGVQAIDRAIFEDSLLRYLGADGPQWSPNWVEVGDVVVLLVAVDPPKSGDPIHLLRKPVARIERGDSVTDYKPRKDEYREASVFVRRDGATHEATVSEHRALQERLRSSTNRVAILVDWAEESPSVTPINLADDGGRWIETERRRLLAPLDQEKPRERTRVFRVDPDTNGPTIAELIELERRRDAGDSLTESESAILEESGKQFQRLRDSLSSVALGFGSEGRTHDEYRAQVEDYVEDLKESVAAHALERFCDSGMGDIVFRVENTTERNFADVELEVYIDAHVMALEVDYFEAKLPRSPRLWGARKRFGYEPITLPSPVVSNSPSPRRRTLEIDNSNSVRLRFALGDLRPGQMLERTERVSLCVAAEHAGESLEVGWRVTAKDADGSTHGTLMLVVLEEAIGLSDLMEMPAPDPDPD